MFPRSFVLCALLVMPHLPTVGQGSRDVFHFGQNILVRADQRTLNTTCVLCSADIEGRVLGNVHVFAGNTLINGTVSGNVLVFGGHVALTNNATVAGRLLIVGGHLHQESATGPAHTVVPPIIFLPIIVLLCIAIAGLILFTRRMVSERTAYPPLRRR